MVSGHHMTEQFTEVKGYSALRFSLKLKPSQIRSPRYAVCTEHCLVCEKRLDTVQSVNCTLPQSHCPGGAGNSAFQWARSRTGPPHHREAQTTTWPRLAELAALYHAWSKKRGGKLAGRFPCASSPSRAALLKLRYKFILPCSKGGHNLENWTKHFTIPCY